MEKGTGPLGKTKYRIPPLPMNPPLAEQLRPQRIEDYIVNLVVRRNRRPRDNAIVRLVGNIIKFVKLKIKRQILRRNQAVVPLRTTDAKS